MKDDKADAKASRWKRRTIAWILVVLAFVVFVESESPLEGLVAVAAAIVIHGHETPPV